VARDIDRKSVLISKLGSHQHFRPRRRGWAAVRAKAMFEPVRRVSDTVGIIRRHRQIKGGMFTGMQLSASVCCRFSRSSLRPRAAETRG